MASPNGNQDKDNKEDDNSCRNCDCNCRVTGDQKDNNNCLLRKGRTEEDAPVNVSVASEELQAGSSYYSPLEEELPEEELSKGQDRHKAQMLEVVSRLEGNFRPADSSDSSMDTDDEESVDPSLFQRVEDPEEWEALIQVELEETEEPRLPEEGELMDFSPSLVLDPKETVRRLPPPPPVTRIHVQNAAPKCREAVVAELVYTPRSECRPPLSSSSCEPDVSGPACPPDSAPADQARVHPCFVVPKIIVTPPTPRQAPRPAAFPDARGEAQAEQQEPNQAPVNLLPHLPEPSPSPTRYLNPTRITMPVAALRRRGRQSFFDPDCCQDAADSCIFTAFLGIFLGLFIFMLVIALYDNFGEGNHGVHTYLPGVNGTDLAQDAADSNGFVWNGDSLSAEEGERLRTVEQAFLSRFNRG